MIISVKLVLVNEKKRIPVQVHASPVDSCVSLSKDNLLFSIVILNTTATYRLPNQDKAGDPKCKAHHCCPRVKQHLLTDFEDLNVKKLPM